MLGWIGLAGAGAFADLGIRHILSRRLDGGKNKSLAGGKVVLTKYENEGAMCGFLKDQPDRLRMLSAAAMGGAIGWFAAKLTGKRPVLEKLGAAMLVSGAAGNVAERAARGKVTDYMRFPFLPGKAGQLVFNLADFLILGGTAIGAFGGFLSALKRKQAES